MGKQRVHEVTTCLMLAILSKSKKYDIDNENRGVSGLNFGYEGDENLVDMIHYQKNLELKIKLSTKGSSE